MSINGSVKFIHCFYVLLSFVGIVLPVQADFTKLSFFEIVKTDYTQFYTSERLFRAGIMFTGGAVFANTSLDQNIQDDYQANVRSDATDDFSAVVKTFGEGKYLIPISLAAALSAYYPGSPEQDSALARWGQKTLRAYLVGGSATLLTQQLTGASRPGETANSSEWNPFNDSNGVSGHAFVAAVPFMTVANMFKENVLVKNLFYVASTLTAFSRVNDNSHYFSQAVLGWYLAYEASSTVFENNSASETITFHPVILQDSIGLGLSLQW